MLLVAAIIAYLFLLPLLFMVFTSFKGLGEALTSSSLIPKKWNIQNYIDLFNNPSSSPMLQWALNTIVVTLAGTVLRLSTSVLAAYAIARLNVPFRKFWIMLIIAAMAIPEIVTIFPMFYMFKSLTLTNTLLALFLPSGANAMTVYLFYNFMKGFPLALEEAAFMDGASVGRILWSVILPSMRPVLITQGFISLLSLYNTYLWPSLVINRTDNRTLTLGIAALVLGENATNPGLMMAATCIAVLPVLLLFIFINRYVVAGVTQAGIK